MEFVTPYYKLHLIHADEDDNKFVDCAFSAGGSCIVSNDAHFKTLNEIKFPRIFVVNIKDFVSYYCGIKEIISFTTCSLIQLRRVKFIVFA